MKLETYKQADRIQCELDQLNRWINQCHHIPTITMYIKRDGERDATKEVPISDELSSKIIKIIHERIDELNAEFNSL